MMQNVFRCWVVSVLMLVLCLPACAAVLNINHFQTEGNSLFVKTSHLEARFDGPNLVYLKNTRTSEVYTADGSPELELGKIKVQGSSDKRFTLGGWGMITNPQSAVYTGKSQGTEFKMAVRTEENQLVITCSGKSEMGGVCAIAWGVGNLSLKETSAVLPVKAGRILSSTTNTAYESFDYPTNWEAQFIVIQGDKGTACIYSTDQSMRFKRLDTIKQKGTYNLVFQTDNQAPFTDLKNVESVEWRIDCLKGDWRTAVDFYKKQMTDAGLLKQNEIAGKQEWPKKIRGHVRVGGDFTNAVVLDELAKQVIPEKTLLYLADWRRDGYDVYYPDYTAKQGVREYVKHAQKLGFRVMLHVDLPGVSPTHPIYEQVKQYHVKDSHSLELIGWLWDKDVPQRFAFINPASGKFRQIFVDAMRGVVKDYGPDAVHLDVSGPMWNDGNGLIDGINYCQGSVKLHKELLAAMPELVLVGETINEILAPYEHFAQRWAWNCSLDPHPVCDYFFSGLTQSYGYLGQPNPDFSPAGFLQYIKPYESQGVVPTMVIHSVKEFDRPGAKRWFKVIRAWQTHDLEPDWEHDWSADVLFKLNGRDGINASIQRTAHGVRMLCGNEVLYERLEGVQQAKIDGHVENHAAYTSNNVIGLDPARCYWVEPGKPDDSLPHITRIDGDVLVTEARISDDLVAFGFSPGSKNTVLDMWEMVGAASVGTIFQGKREPVERGATFDAINASVNGTAKRGIVAHPPWQPRIDSSATSLGQTSAVYTVRLPDEIKDRCNFEVWLGVNDEAKETDGVTFIVKLNNEEALRKHVTKDMKWQYARLDLTKYVGQTIDIELITDPGPDNNTSWDQGVWGTPKVVLTGEMQHYSIDIDIPKRPLWSVPTDAESVPKSDCITQANVSYREDSGSDRKQFVLPANIYFSYKQPDTVELPFDLAGISYNTGLLVDGAYREESIWGSGSPETLKIDDNPRKAINGHPPAKGCTFLTWLLQLPEEKSLLEFKAGVKPNASTSGVGFSARVNGQILWEKHCTRPEWRDGSVDLSKYAGQKIVLELVTDAMGEDFCDWASWVEPRIVAAKN